MRRLLQALDVDAPHVIIHGKTYTRVGRYEALYETKAGPVKVLRSVYREDGKRTSNSEIGHVTYLPWSIFEKSA
jgi:hypothetical protein